MDLCTGGELFEKISEVGSFTEKDAANIFKQMMNAVNYCVIKKICHKDLKPENFMYASKDAGASLKLIDFGLSEFFEDSIFLTKNANLLYRKNRWEKENARKSWNSIFIGFYKEIALLYCT